MASTKTASKCVLLKSLLTIIRDSEQGRGPVFRPDTIDKIWDFVFELADQIEAETTSIAPASHV